MSHLPASYISDAYAADIVRRRFSVNQDIALAIAMAESGLNVNAHNDRGEDSRGIWQINVGPGANEQYADWNLYDPEINAQAAYEVSSSGTYWCPWSVYEESCGPGHTGSYRAFLDRARRALALPPPPPPHEHWPAGNLNIGQFDIYQCILSTQFYWSKGGPDLTGQRLDLAIYPFSFEQGVSFSLPANQASVPFNGFVPGAGYYWRIVSLFGDTSPLYSGQHEFVVPDLPASCYPNPPPPPPWPFIPPVYIYPSDVTILLGAGLVAVSVILALVPRKKKIIKKVIH